MTRRSRSRSGKVYKFIANHLFEIKTESYPKGELMPYVCYIYSATENIDDNQRSFALCLTSLVV